MTDRSRFTFFHTHRVRWAEVDAQAIVFNANYFVLVDYAVSEYFRALDMMWDRTKALGFDFFTVNANCNFRSPAVLDDLIEIGFRCARFGSSSVVYEFAIYRGDELLADGSMTYVCADIKTRRPIPLPDVYTNRITAFEKTPVLSKQAA
ncbi:acyl-CoA thioesterase [Hyphobacterium marinum]|uniref:Thioesterase family protein n=1 Tax=Hyphobacterium marinum TaxID=3116574 RepID=A0ABU7LVE4_9PROT|nr:thioesterase family protein [Hyphobacterium sp. Y6023]MEE2565529.1 thioesterase family protein [Hyphobacterium sp. Y6023]